ncbi:hypothetical protein B0H15DRAFT_855573 [Mycena belliarum]|uniref:Zn(2)-C6 fungal-type domain-containing protein n=1 Tax=Mycena belliarum TaxID=1033014 RepID=A0AAD6U0W2_9AGAR|nr:hypothetical protein B0H15DRAFT_855573 [Mycena belliae]
MPVPRKVPACSACRQKKKKCDGKLPCGTCISGRYKIHCEYPDALVVFEKTLDGDWRRVIPSAPSASESPDSEQSSSELEIGSSAPLTPPEITSEISSRPTPHIFNAADIPYLPDGFKDLSFALDTDTSDMVPYPVLSEIIRARDTFIESMRAGADGADLEEFGLSISGDNEILHTARSFTVTDPLEGTIAQSTNETFNPDTKEEELSQIRQLFLKHRFQFGLSVPDGVVNMISKGEISADADIVLHPVVLHACQLIGYMIARHFDHNTWYYLPDQSEREAEQTRLTLASLQQLGVAECPVAYLQTATLLALYFRGKGDPVRSNVILAKGAELVLTRLDATLLNPPAPVDNKRTRTSFNVTPTTKAAEAQAAFAQLVFLDLSQMIIQKLPSVLAPELYEKFKLLIRDPPPSVEINFLRAKSAFLLHEAQQLAVRCRQGSLDEAQTTAWQTRYWELMEAIDEQRGFLALTLTRVAFSPALYTLGLSLKLCTVCSLTALCALLEIFSDEQPDLERKERETVTEIMSVSLSFTDDDCQYLDPILSACWTAIIISVDECMALQPGHAAECMHNLPGFARAMRQRNQTLQQALPSVVLDFEHLELGHS